MVDEAPAGALQVLIKNQQRRGVQLRTAPGELHGERVLRVEPLRIRSVGVAGEKWSAEGRSHAVADALLEVVQLGGPDAQLAGGSVKRPRAHQPHRLVRIRVAHGERGSGARRKSGKRGAGVGGKACY